MNPRSSQEIKGLFPFSPFLLLLLFSMLASCATTYSQYDVTRNPQAVRAEEYVKGGMYDRALASYRSAYQAYEAEGSERGMLLCLERMGWLQREIGEYGEALELFRKAYPLGLRLNGDASEIDADLGDIYLLSGDSERAGEHYEKVLFTLKDFVFRTSYSSPPGRDEITAMVRKTKAIVHARDNLGTLYYFAREYDRALKNLREAEALIARVKTVAEHPLYGMFFKLDSDFHEGVGFCETIMGATLGETGRFDMARRHFQAGREAFQKGERHYGLLLNEALRYKIEFLSPDRRTDSAKFKEYEDFLERADRFGAADIIWRMCHEIGRALVAEKRYGEAKKYLARAVDALELTRSRLKEDTMKKMFAASVQDVYAEMIRLLYEMKDLEEGFDYLERSKARAFLDMLGGRSVRAKPSVDPALVEREAEIQGRIEVLARRLRSGNEKDRDVAYRAYKGLQKERKDVLERIKSQSLEYAATTTVATVSAGRVLAGLQKGTALVSYFPDRGRTLVWILKEGVISAVAAGAGSEKIGEMVAEYREAVDSHQELLVADMGKALSDLLILPILEGIEGADTLFIVPSRALHYLPFSSLPLSGGRFLVENYTINILPNASSLFFLGERVTPDRETLFAMGNPERESKELSLEYAEEEVRSISRDFPRSTVLTRGEARESALKGKDLSGTGIVHIAAHGKYDAAQPLKSAILLSRDDREDGNLETLEIFSLELNPRLIVLSACRSGVGKLEGGDEVQGLNRAFIYAGAGGVVASLWNVADRSTYKLMTYLYASLEGRTPAGALREAQLRLMKEYPSPYYWAPFYLTGGVEK